MSLIVIHDCDCGENHQASDLDELDEICPAYISREASTSDLIEAMRKLPFSNETTTNHYDRQEGPYGLDFEASAPGRYLVFRLDGGDQ